MKVKMLGPFPRFVSWRMSMGEEKDCSGWLHMKPAVVLVQTDRRLGVWDSVLMELQASYRVTVLTPGVIEE
jgi:hypothetical protein